MWTDWLPVAIVVAIITVAGTIYGVKQTRKTAVETNKVNETEFLMQNLSQEIKRQDERIDKLDKTVGEQGEQIRRLQAQEWTLKRFIWRLMERIRELGGEPPEPPFDMSS